MSQTHSDESSTNLGQTNFVSAKSNIRKRYRLVCHADGTWSKEQIEGQDLRGLGTRTKRPQPGDVVLFVYDEHDLDESYHENSLPRSMTTDNQTMNRYTSSGSIVWEDAHSEVLSGSHSSNNHLQSEQSHPSATSRTPSLTCNRSSQSLPDHENQAPNIHKNRRSWWNKLDFQRQRLYDKHPNTQRYHSKGYERGWKNHRGGHSIESTDLYRLWDWPWNAPATNAPHGTVLDVGINLLFATDSPDEEAEARNLLQSTDKESHTLTINNSFLVFITQYNGFRVLWRRDNTVEVYVRKSPKSTLCERLEQQLHSSQCALHLPRNEAGSGLRFFLHDLMDVLQEEWFTFLWKLKNHTEWKASRYESAKDFQARMPDLGDREHVEDFVRIVEDLRQAFAINAALIQQCDGLEGEDLQKFTYLNSKLTMKIDRLYSIVWNIRENVNNLVSRADSLVNERQTAILRNLTLVASIFLPLTLACSLLSMSNRITAVGAVWWDWLDLVVVTGLLVLICLRVMQAWHDWKKGMHYSLRKVTTNYYKLKEQRNLIPGVPRVAFIIAFIACGFGVPVALLLGIFFKIEVGAVVLGYCIAGPIAFWLFIVVLWRLSQALHWLAKSFRSDENILYNVAAMEVKGTKPAPSIAKRLQTKLSGISHVTGKSADQALATSVFTVGRLLYSLFAFFLGLTLAGILRSVCEIFFDPGNDSGLRQRLSRVNQGTNEEPTYTIRRRRDSFIRSPRLSSSSQTGVNNSDNTAQYSTAQHSTADQDAPRPTQSLPQQLQENR